MKTNQEEFLCQKKDQKQKEAKMLIEEYQPQSAQDIQEALKDLLGDTMEELLKAELDEHLDYEYGEKPISLNTRNGTSKKNSISIGLDKY